MVSIHRRLAALPPGTAALVHQMHDELLLEVQEGRQEQVGGWAVCAGSGWCNLT